jgi:hypothetical protein
MDDIRCMKCSGGKLARIERRGFLEKKIFRLLGYYPWRCRVCKRHFLLKKRGSCKRKAESRSEFSPTYSLKPDRRS